MDGSKTFTVGNWVRVKNKNQWGILNAKEGTYLEVALVTEKDSLGTVFLIHENDLIKEEPPSKVIMEWIRLGIV